MDNDQQEHFAISTLKNCHAIIKKMFSYLANSDNLFQLNKPSDEPCLDMILPKSSLSKFLSPDSIIYDELIPFYDVNQWQFIQPFD